MRQDLRAVPGDLGRASGSEGGDSKMGTAPTSGREASSPLGIMIVQRIRVVPSAQYGIERMCRGEYPDFTPRARTRRARLATEITRAGGRMRHQRVRRKCMASDILLPVSNARSRS